MFAKLVKAVRARGWTSVMPLVPSDKRPVLKGWQRFNSAAPTDAEIEAWCRAYPTLYWLLTLACGQMHTEAAGMRPLRTAFSEHPRAVAGMISTLHPRTQR